VGGCGLDASDLGYGPVAGTSESGNELSGSIKSVDEKITLEWILGK
jgi:hypothetical protein